MQKKNEFIELRNKKIEGVMLRSRSRYEGLGEKPSNYFFNLENRNYNNKVMIKFEYENGEEFDKIKDILGCQKDFYQSLYFNHTNIDDTPLREVIRRRISFTGRRNFLHRNTKSP